MRDSGLTITRYVIIEIKNLSILNHVLLWLARLKSFYSLILGARQI